MIKKGSDGKKPKRWKDHHRPAEVAQRAQWFNWRLWRAWEIQNRNSLTEDFGDLERSKDINGSTDDLKELGTTLKSFLEDPKITMDQLSIVKMLRDSKISMVQLKTLKNSRVPHQEPIKHWKSQKSPEALPVQKSLQHATTGRPPSHYLHFIE